MNLTPGRALHSRLVGAFLFLPLLTSLGFDRLVAAAGYPGSEMVPATSALLALLSLKLLDKERRSHIDDFNCDEALGLFAGLNVLPKKSFATDYSYRVVRNQQLGLLQGWVKALAPVMFPAPEGFSLDFHPIPYRGDPAGLDRHYLPRRGSRPRPSSRTFSSASRVGSPTASSAPCSARSRHGGPPRGHPRRSSSIRATRLASSAPPTSPA